MVCIDTHLTVYLLNFNKYYLYNILYAIVTHYQNKRLYNILFSFFFDRTLIDFVEDLKHTQNPS